jgi:hypothetical protein
MSSLERRILWFVALTGLGAACLVVFLFNPEQYHFYPQCLFHQVTGWECPGCGGLRATYQLLHGNLAAAWGFNPLVVLMAPVAGWIIARELIREATGKVLPGKFTQPVFVWMLVPTVVLFGILRNVW